MEEIWKSVPGFDAEYQVSDRGRVRSLKCGRERILKTGVTGKSRAYQSVHLVRPDGSKTCTTLQRMVYLAFTGPIPDGFEIDHIDDNPENNRPDNLRAVSRQENMAKSWERRRAMGKTAMHKLGDHCKRGHAYDVENTRIARDGYRYCKACEKHRYEAKKRVVA